MTQARKAIVSIDEVGIYHCISRCVRRAFLCGEDSYSGKNYEHRRGWVRERIEFLSGLFGMEIFAYAVMSNHLHLVVRSRPDLVSTWSVREVAERWCRLFRGEAVIERGDTYDAVKFQQLLSDAEALEQCRERLKDLSWLMRCLSEPLARRANKEDSHFTSIYDRVVSKRAAARLQALGEVKQPTYSQKQQIQLEQGRQGRCKWLLDLDAPESPFEGVDTDYYLRLVEWTGQNLRADKPGYIPVALETVMDRYGLDAENWSRNVKRYGRLFHRIVGPADQLLDYARRRGQAWFRGKRGSEQLYQACRQAA